jgi:hypothetical protein
VTCLFNAWFQRGDAYFMCVFSYPLFLVAPGNWAHIKGALLSLFPLRESGLKVYHLYQKVVNQSVTDSVHDYPFTTYSDIKLCTLCFAGQKLKWEFRKQAESAFDFLNISKISLDHVSRDMCSLFTVICRWTFSVSIFSCCILLALLWYTVSLRTRRKERQDMLDPEVRVATVA